MCDWYNILHIKKIKLQILIAMKTEKIKLEVYKSYD